MYGATKAGVLAKLSEMSHESRNGLLTEPSTATIAEYLRDWLDNSAKPVIRTSTHANYKNTIEKHIIPIIGGVRLKKLSPAHVQGLYATLSERLAPKTIRASHIILRKSLALAVRWRFINRDPSQDVKPPSVPHREMRVLDAEQARKLLKAAEGERLYALYLTALSTGMRMAELCGLQWGDVDLSGKRLSVVRTATHIAGKLVVDSPKTKRSRRTIDLSAGLVAALNDHRKLLVREGLAGCPWVFPSTAGTPLQRNNLHAKSFKPILKRAKLPDMRFHDLRHSAATLLLTQGVNPKVVAEMLGHASIAITLDVYSHVLPSMQQDAAARLEAVLTGGRGSHVERSIDDHLHSQNFNVPLSIVRS